MRLTVETALDLKFVFSKLVCSEGVCRICFTVKTGIFTVNLVIFLAF